MDLFEGKPVVYHECNCWCIPNESINPDLCGIISMSKWKFGISMRYIVCKYLGGISETKISEIIMGYIQLIITINASEIDDSTVDYGLGVILDNNTFPNYIMTVRVDEVVPNYNFFSVTTKNNDCVIKYGNDVCLHDITEMFIRQAEYSICYCEEQ